MKTWRDIEELSDRGQLIALIEQYGTPTRIARAVGCSVATVKNAMYHHGIQTKKYSVGDDVRRRLNL